MGLKELRERARSDPQFIEDFRADYPHEAAAAAIQQLRADLGWTQEQLARASGVTQSVIARAESGRHSFEIALLDKIADAAGVTWRPAFDPSPANLADLANVIPLFEPVRTVPRVAESSAECGLSVSPLANPPAEAQKVRVVGG